MKFEIVDFPWPHGYSESFVDQDRADQMGRDFPEWDDEVWDRAGKTFNTEYGDKKELTDTIEEKDSRIKKILIQLEQANQDVQSAGKKIAELEKKLNKKQTIKRVIDEKITEVLENIEENKDSESVDKEGTDMVKDIYEK